MVAEHELHRVQQPCQLGLLGQSEKTAMAQPRRRTETLGCPSSEPVYHVPSRYRHGLHARDEHNGLPGKASLVKGGRVGKSIRVPMAERRLTCNLWPLVPAPGHRG